MSVRCPRCGHEYDVTLFQFGRTVACDCGERVSWPARTTPEIRLVADAMLGRLARWLRFVGIDAAYAADVDDRDLAERARREGRVVLTRDTLLPRRFKDVHCLLVESEAVAEQLAQVVAALGIERAAAAFTRCTRCNARLEPLAREVAAGRVPERVLLERERFLECPACGRVYWEGSHARRMRAALERALGERGTGSAPRL